VTCDWRWKRYMLQEASNVSAGGVVDNDAAGLGASKTLNSWWRCVVFCQHGVFRAPCVCLNSMLQHGL
jgi:hypothetical protein